MLKWVERQELYYKKENFFNKVKFLEIKLNNVIDKNKVLTLEKMRNDMQVVMRFYLWLKILNEIISKGKLITNKRGHGYFS